MASVIPLVVIVGPTASGKSALALEIAHQYDGEIVAADSRTVYKGLDIGTAKPTPEEQRQAPHHMIDIVEPDERFTLGDFQSRAYKIIKDIRSRGKVPILVGGTGLYVDSIIFEYKLGTESDPVVRAQLEQETVESLQTMIKDQHLPMPENKQNKRHLIRVIEQRKINSVRKNVLADHCIVVGISTDNKVLEKRIHSRITAMFEQGIIEETTRITSQYGWNVDAISSNIYRLVRQVIEGSMTVNEAINAGTILDRRLAKRQRTWFRRNPFIHWGDQEEIKTFLMDQLHRLGIRSMLR